MKKSLILIASLLLIIISQAQVNPPSVKIGTQTWMLKNLDADRYRNGDPIPEVKDSAEWSNLTTGAWCYYENNSANGTVYSKLYNWYAVNDPRGLAPEDWHIPSDAEWTAMENNLGGSELAGGEIKETGTTYWLSPNIWATNSSGFTGLPGGDRYKDGTFYSVGSYGNWWSSAEFNSTGAWYRSLYYNDGHIRRGSFNKRNGLSVRCIRD